MVEFVFEYTLFQGRKWKPLQYSCLENSMDGGASQAAVHGIAKSWTRLSDFTFLLYFFHKCIRATCEFYRSMEFGAQPNLVVLNHLIDITGDYCIYVLLYYYYITIINIVLYYCCIVLLETLAQQSFLQSKIIEAIIKQLLLCINNIIPNSMV